MKRLSALTFGLLVSLGLALSANAAPQFGNGRDRGESRDRVCVYQDIHYQGWEQCYNAGDEINTLGGRNNAVSSIRMYGRATVTVYEETNFRGRSVEFNSSIPDLGLRNLAGSKSWSDHIQSLRVGGSSQGGGYNPGRDYPGNGNGRNYPDQYPGSSSSNSRNMTGVCVYDQKDFRGREQCFDPGSQITDLARAGNWSDRIQSIRVFGRSSVTLYRDVGFRGGNVTVDRDVPDLSQISGNGFGNWDKQASSMTIGNDRSGRGRGRDRYWR